ncbi:MAG TPA: C40 family peptidase [Thermoanaerobaculia bacterium]|nr:C40 family peptidase [Thermoanaerobaculia bacterium]
MRKSVIAVVLGVFLASAVFAEEPPPAPVVDAQPKGMVDRALSWIGVKYRFGGQDEKKGFDCAGLVRRAFSRVVDLPRTAASQFTQGFFVEREDLQPGDLVFFKNTYKKGISHVGIYIGDGQFVHAASSRRAVVVDRLASTYFSSRFAGGRRIVQDAMRPPVLGAVGDQLEALRQAHDPAGESN